MAAISTLPFDYMTPATTGYYSYDDSTTITVPIIYYTNDDFVYNSPQEEEPKKKSYPPDWRYVQKYITGFHSIPQYSNHYFRNRKFLSTKDKRVNARKERIKRLRA